MAASPLLAELPGLGPLVLISFLACFPLIGDTQTMTAARDRTLEVSWENLESLNLGDFQGGL